MGLKRHITADTQALVGMLLHSAPIQDGVCGTAALVRLFYRVDTITRIFVDAGHTGKHIAKVREMSDTKWKW